MAIGHDESINQHPGMMTEERLREYLFGGQKVPFWNYDPTQISIGMEIEYFIAHVHGQSFKLATQREYLQVVEHLKNDSGYRDRQLSDQPGRVSLDTENGFVAIKPDFAWHILEISLPPRKSLEDLRALITAVFKDVDSALSKVGLQRLDISCLPSVPSSMDLVALDRLGEIATTFNPKSIERPTQDPAFPAFITATHVHLNASSEDMLAFLPMLYKLDRLVSERFTRARIFCGAAYDNARTLMYRDTLGPDYLLHTYPKEPANSLESLSNLMNQSPKLFPKDRFFPVRDMSYIRPTRYGTLEFRSACSYRDIDKLVEIARWRCAQLIAATIKSPDLIGDKTVKELSKELKKRVA